MGQWLSLVNERNGLEKLTAELTLKWVNFTCSIGILQSPWQVPNPWQELLILRN